MIDETAENMLTLKVPIILTIVLETKKRTTETTNIKVIIEK